MDTFHGKAWVGVIPLFMKDVHPRFVPAVPMISDFLELNVRTYVLDVSFYDRQVFGLRILGGLQVERNHDTHVSGAIDFGFFSL